MLYVTFSCTNVKIAKIPSSVVVLTPDNFNEIVLDEKRDVLVEFYALWYGHCKNLALTCEKVAKAFGVEEDGVIANVDADNFKDLAEKYGVSGFPTLKFLPKNNEAGEEQQAKAVFNRIEGEDKEVTGCTARLSPAADPCKIREDIWESCQELLGQRF